MYQLVFADCPPEVCRPTAASSPPSPPASEYCGGPAISHQPPPSSGPTARSTPRRATPSFSLTVSDTEVSNHSALPKSKLLIWRDAADGDADDNEAGSRSEAEPQPARSGTDTQVASQALRQGR